MDKLIEGQEISIVDKDGQVVPGYKIFHPKQDKAGFISVEKDGSVDRVHPKRIVTGEQMSQVIAAPPAVTEPKITTTKPKVAPEKVDLADIAKVGELWVKESIEFDGKTSVNTLCLLFPTQNRYLSFNIYNGSFGKKGKKPPIEAILGGSQDVGYPLKDIEKQRADLMKKGYKKFGS